MEPGTILDGRFVLAHIAGRGGMGAVWRALDQHTGDPVALKVLHRRVARDESERLLREGQVLASLRHPGIVRYVAHGLTPQALPYLVMEWVEGESLAARLRRARLSVDDTLTLLGAVAGVLGAVHARGIVHRDIKPQNLLVPPGGIAQIKLLDFGIARWDDVMYAMTRTGVIIGTLHYMAPEQAEGERDLSARVDVFALGCVVFECLCGHPPFADADDTRTLVRLTTEEAPRAASLRPDVPRGLDDLVAAMLARDPARRLADGRVVHGLTSALVARPQ